MSMSKFVWQVRSVFLFAIMLLLSVPVRVEGGDVRMLDQGSGIGIHTPSRALMRDAVKDNTSWLEPDTKRPGADYRSFSAESPEVCQEACAEDPDCKAYTYVKPDRIEGTPGRCYLKSAVPDPVGNDCCVSGVKPPSSKEGLVREVTPEETSGGKGGGGMVLVKPIEPPAKKGGERVRSKPGSQAKKSKAEKSPEPVEKNPPSNIMGSIDIEGIKDKTVEKKEDTGVTVHIQSNMPQHRGSQRQRHHGKKESKPGKRPSEEILESIDIGKEYKRQTDISIKPGSGKGSESPYEDILKAIERGKKQRDQEASVSQPPTVSKPSVAALKKVPDWWHKFNEYAKGVEITYQLNPLSIDGLKNHPDCQNDIVMEMVIQKHGQAIIDGAAALKVDEQRAKERFADAVKELSRFASSLYCVDIRGLQFWDRTISDFWNGMAKQSLPDLEFGQAMLATWNPALLVIDAIQFTGESKIIETFKKLEPQIKNALKNYPINTYGAAWLDDFGTGKLVRIGGRGALDNLVKIIDDPVHLGLGLCGLNELATDDTAVPFCLAGIKPKLCNATDAADVFDILLELGVASLEIDEYPLNSNNDGMSGGRNSGWTFKVKERYPQSYFGTKTENLLGLGTNSTLKNSLCGSKGGGALRPSAYGQCIFNSLISAGEHPGQRATICTRKYSTPLMKKPFKPILIDWGKFLQCGVTNPIKDKLGPLETRTHTQKLLDKVVKEMRKDAQKPGHDIGHRKARNIVDKAEVNGISKGDTIGWNKIKKEGLVDEDTAGYADTENNKIYINPSLSEAQKRETLTHEKLHIYFNARGVSPYEKLRIGGITINTLHHAYMRQYGWYRPTPDSPGGGGCTQNAAAIRAQLWFDCVFGEEDAVSPMGSLDPLIRPTEPLDNRGLMCDQIDTSAFWRDSTGSGVTDPEGPEDLMGGRGPMIKKFVPEKEGVIDPIKTESIQAPGTDKERSRERDKIGLPGEVDEGPGNSRD